MGIRWKQGPQFNVKKTSESNVVGINRNGGMNISCFMENGNAQKQTPPKGPNYTLVFHLMHIEN